MAMIFTMATDPKKGTVKGVCAGCGKSVFEDLATLDDCYNVWLGECPHCKALNYLALTGLRGYSSQGMELVSPTAEEIDRNNLPKDTPTSGACGKPANVHGSNLGELLHKIRGDGN